MGKELPGFAEKTHGLIQMHGLRRTKLVLRMQHGCKHPHLMPAINYESSSGGICLELNSVNCKNWPQCGGRLSDSMCTRVLWETAACNNKIHRCLTAWTPSAHRNPKPHSTLECNTDFVPGSYRFHRDGQLQRKREVREVKSGNTACRVKQIMEMSMSNKAKQGFLAIVNNQRWLRNTGL